MNLRSFILLSYTRRCPIICTRAGERKKNKRTLFRADYPSWIRGKAVSRGRASPRLRFPPRLPERKAASSALPGTRPFPGKLPGTGRVRKTGAGKAAGRRQAVACQGREHTQRLLFRPVRRFLPLSTKGMIGENPYKPVHRFLTNLLQFSPLIIPNHAALLQAFPARGKTDQNRRFLSRLQIFF